MKAQHRHLNSGVYNRSCAQQQSYRNGEEWKLMSRRITVMDSQMDGISSKLEETDAIQLSQKMGWAFEKGKETGL